MTTISGKIDVRAVATLAHLELTEAEVAEFQADLTMVLEYVEQIPLLDLDGVEPATRAFESENILRADTIRPGLSREKALDNAPSVLGEKLFEVPVVIEDGDA